MDQGLLSWARAVKQRRKSRLPVLWLFSDAVRLPDPLPAIAALPPQLCGVVFRQPENPALARAVARLCRSKNITLVIAGDSRLAAAQKSGLHLRGGRRPGLSRPRPGLLTSSAHNIPELRRAARAGAQIIFISPVFVTNSHPGAPALGAARWLNLARSTTTGKAYALGGLDGQKIISLARFCCGAAAIEALKT
jgi:thiamine-phosphate pyrophosphorylase